MKKQEQLRVAFSKATNKFGAPMEQVELLPALYKECPELKDLEFKKWVDHGVFGNVAFIGDYVIKAPKENTQMDITQSITHFQKECNFLQKLDKHPLVPNVMHIGEQFNFCVMQRMPGVVLGETNGKRTPEQDKRIATTVADFYHYLAKALPVEENPGIDTPYDYVSNQINHIEKTLEKKSFRKFLGSIRCKEYLEIVNAIKDAFENSKPVLIDNDLHQGNMLVDKKDPGKITGFLDFGIIVKCRIPEMSFCLGEDINRLTSSIYSADREYKNGYDLYTASHAFYGIREIVWDGKKTSKKDIKRIDRFVAKSKTPMPS